MCNLNTEFSEAYKYLKEGGGGFTVLLSGSVHSQIPMDQIIETTINCFSKEAGGLSGITENKGTSERWVRINPFIVALRDHLNVKLNKNKKHMILKWGAPEKKKMKKM